MSYQPTQCQECMIGKVLAKTPSCKIYSSKAQDVSLTVSKLHDHRNSNNHSVYFYGTQAYVGGVFNIQLKINW